ncbi:hypothetical protein BD413DRAFT_42641 [Trametes elegans]|nr:hypothetical protein BD413DRAFT_42641 [Trametes elegans]
MHDGWPTCFVRSRGLSSPRPSAVVWDAEVERQLTKLAWGRPWSARVPVINSGALTSPVKVRHCAFKVEIPSVGPAASGLFTRAAVSVAYSRHMIDISAWILTCFSSRPSHRGPRPGSDTGASGAVHDGLDAVRPSLLCGEGLEKIARTNLRASRTPGDIRRCHGRVPRRLKMRPACVLEMMRARTPRVSRVARPASEHCQGARSTDISPRHPSGRCWSGADVLATVCGRILAGCPASGGGLRTPHMQDASLVKRSGLQMCGAR